ncbi:MAG: hypothetical protein IPO67_14245 [Deltaproteobacteria bacterium]|nr:hypothetical protein [Deltaproteobacteria bacterium]
MSDDSPRSRSAPRGAAATALEEALEAVAAHQQAVMSLKAEAARRDEQREQVILAHNARSEAIRAEARSLMRLIPKHRAAEWSRAERAQVKEALRAAVALRLIQTLGELPPVPAPAPLEIPKLRLTPPQRRALGAAERRAKKQGQTLLPEGFQLIRPYKKKKARPLKVPKKVSQSGQPRATSARPREEPVVVTVSSSGAWSISEDGLE